MLEELKIIYETAQKWTRRSFLDLFHNIYGMSTMSKILDYAVKAEWWIEYTKSIFMLAALSPVHSKGRWYSKSHTYDAGKKRQLQEIIIWSPQLQDEGGWEYRGERQIQG